MHQVRERYIQTIIQRESEFMITAKGTRMLFPKLMYSCLIFVILLTFSYADGLPFICDVGLPFPYANNLEVGYYDSECPAGVKIEDIIREAVYNAVAGQEGLCAGVIRLHFHDCFVRGCDGSVLLNNDTSNPNPEKFAGPNRSLRGFEVIDAAKAAVEEKCPNAVSCADVLAFAARDCVYFLGKFSYTVPAGRLDGKVSKAEDVFGNLPGPFFNITQLKDNFANKSLSSDDLVVLSAAHSIGVAHCGGFKSRITEPINSNQIDANYAESLREECLSDSVTVPQDNVTANVLDNQYYKNNLNNEVLFFSDWSLRDDMFTQALMTTYSLQSDLWQGKFGCAMKKMGQIIELSPGQGEIRKTCSAVNGPTN